MNTINFFQFCSVLSVVCILFYVPLSRFFVTKGAVPYALKMQNKAKFKTAQIPLTPYNISTNKKVLRPPQPKNKAKQTQIDTKCHPERSEVLWPERRMSLSRATSRERIYLNSHPDLSGFHNFAICALIFDMLFMTNKPNFRKCKMTVCPFLKNTYNRLQTASDQKSKPKQTQFKVAQASSLIVTLASSRLLKTTKMVNPVILSAAKSRTSLRGFGKPDFVTITHAGRSYCLPRQIAPDFYGIYETHTKIMKLS